MGARTVLLLALVAAIAGGCTTITVKKVDSAKEPGNGLRYSLPKPFIRMTPQVDGSVEADVVLLPDADNTYEISGSSTFAKHALNVTTAGGMLTKIEWNADGSAATAQAIQSASAIAQKELERTATERQAERTTLAAAEKAVVDTKLTLRIAQEKLRLLIEAGSPEPDTRNAAIAVEEAKIRLEAAEASLAALRGQRVAGNKRVDAGDARTSSAASQESPAAGDLAGVQPEHVTMIRGPILYAVNERMRGNSPTVELKAVSMLGNMQKSYPTVSVPKKTDPELTFLPSGIIVATRDAKVPTMHALSLIPNNPVTAIRSVTIKTLPALTTAPAGSIAVTREPGDLIKIVLVDVPAGLYQVVFDAEYKEGATSRTASPKIQLRVP
jgi:hypothetical protein